MPKSRPKRGPSENDIKFKDELDSPRPNDSPLRPKDRFWKLANQYLKYQMNNPWKWMNANDGMEAAQESHEDYLDFLESQTPGQGQYVGDYQVNQQGQVVPGGPQTASGGSYGSLGGQVTPEGLFPPGSVPEAPAAAAPATKPEEMLAYGGQGGLPGEDIVGMQTAPQFAPPPPQQAQAQPTSGKLSIPQAYQTFRQAGFDDADARMMTAISMGESGLNPMAHNPNAGTGDNSYGLTQVNMLGDLGPARMQQFGLKSNEDLFDPLTNAKAAFGISGGGQNFSPWSIYKKGAHAQYIDDVNAALANLGNQLNTQPGATPAPTGTPPPADPAQPTQPGSEEEEDEEDDD